jgi:signal transduction histidine kinase
LPHPTGNWLVWLVRTATNRWDNCDGRVLALAGQALLQVLLADISAHVGSVPVDRVRMHERMADAGRLVRRLAHDFDNVLTGVLGFGELAQQQLTAGSPARRYLGELLQAAERGTELTDRLRRFSHGQEINGAQAYLGEVLSQEEAQQKKGLPAAITWVTEVPAHLPRVAMGAEPLRLVLQHLLANAREAIGVAGTITVSATLSLLGGRECLQVLGSPAPGSYVRLVIRDSGPGLSKESQHRVLVEPFYTSKPGHPGLGLPTVFRIVSAHGGGLRLGPSQPHGTQVEVFLPLQPPVASKQ